MEEHSVAKYVKNPKDIKVTTGNGVSRPKAFTGRIASNKSYTDKSKILKGKRPGTGLGDYTLDLMKLG